MRLDNLNSKSKEKNEWWAEEMRKKLVVREEKKLELDREFRVGEKKRKSVLWPVVAVSFEQ